eukprot:6213511-Pleurochrysis_carterae.AAC.1
MLPGHNRNRNMLPGRKCNRCRAANLQCPMFTIPTVTGQGAAQALGLGALTGAAPITCSVRSGSHARARVPELGERSASAPQVRVRCECTLVNCVIVCFSNMGSIGQHRKRILCWHGLVLDFQSIVDMLVKYAAVDATPTVRINDISPGIFSTDVTAGINPDEVIKTVNLIPRPGNPDGIGILVGYLARSDESAYFTGSNMVIDGG